MLSPLFLDWCFSLFINLFIYSLYILIETPPLHPFFSPAAMLLFTLPFSSEKGEAFPKYQPTLDTVRWGPFSSRQEARQDSLFIGIRSSGRQQSKGQPLFLLLRDLCEDIATHLLPMCRGWRLGLVHVCSFVDGSVSGILQVWLMSLLVDISI